MEFETLKSNLELISYLITVFGVPVAIYVYLKEQNKERKIREYEFYESLNDKYLEFLQMCLGNVDLNIISDYYSMEKPEKYTKEQKARELIIFEYLISLLERAFLIFKDQSTDLKKERWEGWNAYMHDWMKIESFQKAWTDYLGAQWDSNFQKHMYAILEKTKSHSRNNP